MPNLISRFWRWYSAHATFNTGLAGGLFLLQLAHLYWLTAHAVSLRLFGASVFNPSDISELIIALVDYTEIPAIILTSLVYINEFRKDHKSKNLWYLFLLNSQWLHIFWITDEILVEQFTSRAAVMLPAWFSWLAIAIDYLELPVMYDTVKKFLVSLAAKRDSTKNFDV